MALSAFFAAQPGVADGALFRVDSLLHRRDQEPGSTPKYQAPLYTACNRPYIEVGEVSACAGGGQRQQCESQRVRPVPRSLKQSDLLSRQQGGEMLIRQNRGQGWDCKFPQAGRKQLENVDAWRLPHKG